ncbi:MAG TPA: glycine oxidase ThiO [Pirellulales bacterium]|nr:glycine oxidase ThiO [Pirellulales bacterium]
MTDCLILGGGVIGLSVAYDLARHGARCRVLERGEPGQEASWAGAGIIPASARVARDHPFDQLAGLSSALHPQWAARLLEETGIDNGYRHCGGIYLARNPEVWHALELAADDWYGRQQPVEKLDSARLHELEPTLGVSFEAAGWPQRVLAGYYLPDEAQIRNPRHLKALQAACRQRAVEIMPQSEVQSFVEQHGRVVGVQTTKTTYFAESILVASGAWTAGLLTQLGVAIRIKPIRGQMVLYRGERPILSHVINDGPRYLVPRDDGRVLVGSTEENVGFVKATTEAGVAGLQKLAGAIAPQVAALPVERTWAGFRPGTADGIPYLGCVPGQPALFVAAGHFRSGLHLSPATGAVMSQLVRGEKPDIDLAPFSLERG